MPSPTAGVQDESRSSGDAARLLSSSSGGSLGLSLVFAEYQRKCPTSIGDGEDTDQLVVLGDDRRTNVPVGHEQA